jgi:DNA-binding response OmpR family regulator
MEGIVNMKNSVAKKKILIIDDDMDLSMIVQDMYEDHGYQVTLALDSKEAYGLLEKNSYHMILLDINLPRITGFEICKELRKISTVPIIFASARTSEDDKITGLDIGGDDFLPKPYSLKELLSRTNSIIRRTYGFEEQNKTIEIGKGTVNAILITTGNRTVTRNGQSVSLSLKEFDLLEFLAEHKNEALKKETILRQVWGTLSEVEMSTLTVHIRWLREKLEENPSQPCYLKTVWGVGYLLEDNS